MKKIKTLTETEQEAIARAASGVWDEVGYDCIQSTAECMGKDINKVSIPQSQVIEIVLDAGRLEERLSPDLIQRWEALTYEQKIAVAKRAFSYTRYGL